MTSVESRTGTGAAPSDGAGKPAASVDRVVDRRPWPVAEALLTLELAGLCAFAFSQPILDRFGRSPETFVARSSSPTEIVLFGLLVTALPVVAVAAVGVLGRPFGRQVRWRVHLALVAVSGGLAVWRVGQDITGWAGTGTKLALIGLLAAPLCLLARLKVPWSRSFLRYASAASVLFLVQFLVMSPTSALIGGEVPGADPDLTRAVSAAVGDDAPPIVFIILDTFPTRALVDGDGAIDAELYPNIAALAESSTWYRNNTTVSGFTNEAVPAMLSGSYPEPSDSQQFVVPYPNNLFTLFGGTHDLHVHEPMTRLCPEDLCPGGSGGGGGLHALLGDAADLWRDSARARTLQKNEVPGLFNHERYEAFRDWIDEQDFGPGKRPGLHFYHAMLPHEPWSFLPDGSVYDASDPPTGVFTTGWSESGHDVGLQRLVLQAQAADRLLGHLFDRLREAGSYDDALIVIAGDHGQSFVPGQPWRAVTPGNYEHIMWTPLIMKAPGQAVGEISDRNVETVDILPTMADMLGVDLPFTTDGLPATGDEQRDADVKHLDDVDDNRLRSEDGESLVEIDAESGLAGVMTADPVPGSGEDAVFRQTRHGDLVGRAVVDLVPEGSRIAGEVGVEDVGRFDEIALGEPLPIEVVGSTDLAEGAVVAYALNGTVAGLNEVRAVGWGNHRVHALLLPAAFEDGANELTAYLVEGPVGSETLRPLDVTDRD